MMRFVVLSILGWMLFVAAPAVMAQPYTDLTAPEVKTMVEEKGAVLIHVLSRLEFDMQHIPGSINIPITEVATSSELPQAKDTPIIFYCMGVR
ncbi:MAG: rhodanese-like domain-containing protein [Desulfovibrionales bacterium]|nr:MAG: rhodanese-like domain-containing protein [Desulfovibrionales bacterium]